MSNINQSNNDLKNIGIILVGLLIFWLVLKQLTYPAPISAYNGQMGMYVDGTTSHGLNGLFLSILGFVLGSFKVLLVVGLLVGGFVYLRRNSFISNNWGFEIFTKNTSTEKRVCTNCQLNVEREYKYCPNCGFKSGDTN